MTITMILLIIGIIIFIIERALDEFSREEHKNIRRLAFVLVLFLLITSAFLEYHNEKEDNLHQEYSQDYGVLSGLKIEEDIKRPQIYCGVGGMMSPSPNHLGPSMILADKPVGVWIENNELKVTASISDVNGEIIAKIKANEWTVYPNNGLDKNFDSTALEVIDKNDIVRMQITYDGEYICIAKLDYDLDGNKHYFGPLNNNGLFAGTYDGPDNIINPIFDYPSMLHKGERI